MSIGIYTQKSRRWEQLQTIPIKILCFIFPWIMPPVLIYMATRARNRLWIIIATVVMTTPFFIASNETLLSVFVILYYIAAILFGLTMAPTYLMRLEARENNPSLPWAHWLTQLNMQPQPMPAKRPSPTPATPMADTPTSKQSTIQEFISKLQTSHNEIDTPKMKYEIARIIRVCQAINNTNTADFFAANHVDTILKLLDKYDEVENSNLTSKDLSVSVASIEEAMSKIAIAFERYLDKHYQDQLSEVNAEASATIQLMHNKGLID